MSIIRLENVSVSFQNHEVLKDVTINIHEGESIVVLGPSGEGKSTLLKTMCGLVTPSDGSVFIKQNKITQDFFTQSEIISSLGILFQKNALFDSLTCLENIVFPLRERAPLSDKERTERAMHFLDEVGLSHAKDLFPDEISGGMQKRLGIARALALHPQVIFYDDPTAGLDPITSRKIIELILKLKKEQGSTIVTVTNDMNRAYQMADRILFICDGKVLETGSVEETKQCKDPRVQQFIQGLSKGPLTTKELQC